ncbi:hypothetical protein NQ314_005355, partial [Rhamnusium bicolor]
VSGLFFISEIMKTILILISCLLATSYGYRADDEYVINNKSFPDSFLFGTATASYQIEGGWDADGKGENIWDRLTHTQPELIKDGNSGDIACDSYHKYKEDVALLKALGVNHYRFSLSWSRILPTGFIYHVNEAGVNYYRNLIKELKDNDIEPLVTIFHWDTPQPIHEVGGFPSEFIVDYFADYARLVFELFGNDVKYWLTFNEPKQICHDGYGTAAKAPIIASNGIGEYLCTHNLLKAHAKAYHIYDEEFRPTQNGQVSIVIDTPWYEPDSDSPEDIVAAETRIQFAFGWYANPIFNGDYPEIMKTRIADRSRLEGFGSSRLPEFTPEEIAYINGTYDYLGLNSYASYLVKAVTPWGMRKLLKWVKDTYNNPAIIITENGYSDNGTYGDDSIRKNYYQTYLSNIRDAMVYDEVNVFGYTVWSLLDNMEWMMGYTEKFGLHHIDFDSPNRTRTPKPSAEYYKNIIATRCLVETCDE